MSNRKIVKRNIKGFQEAIIKKKDNNRLLIKNRFSVFQNKCEEQINAILMVEDLKETRSTKMKCRLCGQKKNCTKQDSCQAEGKMCSFCLKCNHFPKSLNCKKMRKMKQREKNENKVLSGSQTLREFLHSKSFKLISYSIPFEELTKKKIKSSNTSANNNLSESKGNKIAVVNSVVYS